VLSVPAIQLDEPSCANGGPNQGTLLEVHHRLLERRYAGTRRPFADIRQHGSTSWWIVPQADPCSHVLRGRPESTLIFRFIVSGIRCNPDTAKRESDNPQSTCSFQARDMGQGLRSAWWKRSNVQGRSEAIAFVKSCRFRGSAPKLSSPLSPFELTVKGTSKKPRKIFMSRVSRGAVVFLSLMT
jgi:hypothetical protein